MFKHNTIKDSLDKLKIISSNKIVVYSALTDSYDKIHDPKIVPKNIDYILFMISIVFI